ncbi:mucin-2-like [Physella acuta]|uniref:mucin-2-like n=1 Tax=Physella acuta TaxID=109671 RepID=UPI0027DE2C6F|nr:mucin-2-like [Physella acuta]
MGLELKDITLRESPGCPMFPEEPGINYETSMDEAVVKFTCGEGLVRHGPEWVYCDGRLWDMAPPECKPSDELGCDFEKSLCGWSDDTTDDFDWIRNSGETVTGDTGPMVDHTTNTANGYYIYTESSTPQQKGDKARLMSPKIKQGREIDMCLVFFYHMQGHDGPDGMGQLEVFAMPESASSKKLTNQFSLFRVEGNQGDNWIQAVVPIPTQTQAFQLVFQVTIYGWTSDIALDDIDVMNCTEVSRETPPPKVTTQRPANAPILSTTTTVTKSTKAPRKTAPTTQKSTITRVTKTTRATPKTSDTTTSSTTTTQKPTTVKTTKPTKPPTTTRTTKPTTAKPTTTTAKTTPTPKTTSTSTTTTTTTTTKTTTTTTTPTTTITTTVPETTEPLTKSTVEDATTTKEKTSPSPSPTTQPTSSLPTKPATATEEPETDLTTDLPDTTAAFDPTDIDTTDPLTNDTDEYDEDKSTSSPDYENPDIISSSNSTLPNNPPAVIDYETNPNDTNDLESTKINNDPNSGAVKEGQTSSGTKELLPLIVGVVAAVVIGGIVIAVLTYMWARNQRRKNQKEEDDQMNIITEYVETNLNS